MVRAIDDVDAIPVADMIVAELKTLVWNIEGLAELRLPGLKSHYRQLIRANRQNSVSILANFSIGLMMVLRLQMPKRKIRQPVARDR